MSTRGLVGSQFGLYAGEWLSRRSVAASSRDAMERRIRCHMLPTWEMRPLATITPAGVQAWLRELSEKLAPSHVRLVFVTFGAILASAVTDGLLVRSPAKAPGVRAPSVPPRRFAPWTTARVRSVIEATPERYQALVSVAATAGLRQGEAFGLRIQDVSVDRCELRVAQQIKLVDGRPFPAPPKYGRTRMVPVPDWMLAKLIAHVDRWDPLAGGRTQAPGLGGLLFVSREGKPLNRNYFNGSVWRPALAKAAVPSGRENGMHALRHFCASTG